MTPKQALLVATIAHGAKGQTRECGVPYIVHPIKVALLTRTFVRRYWNSEIADAQRQDGFSWFADDLTVAAYLHDVIEDTGLVRKDLMDAGCNWRQIDIVERLTKLDPHGKAPQSYYQGISEHAGALIVKCADRCANLEDAYKDLFVPGEVMTPKRWRNYVVESTTEVMPMYVTMPQLRSEIDWRVKRILAAYPLAKQQRESYVARVRAKDEERKNRNWDVLEGKRPRVKIHKGEGA